VIVLDAGVLIGHFEPADPHHTDASALLKAHVAESFAASVITLTEVYAGAARPGLAMSTLKWPRRDGSSWPRTW
jgi:predicted nucleic acid-binding protein